MQQLHPGVSVKSGKPSSMHGHLKPFSPRWGCHFIFVQATKGGMMPAGSHCVSLLSIILRCQKRCCRRVRVAEGAGEGGGESGEGEGEREL